MATKLSYEPSVQAVLRSTLPEKSEVFAGREALRTRVSWPVRLRATGLGRIQGGEIVLVPSARSAEVLGRISELASAGVAALILPMQSSSAGGALGEDTAPALAFVGDSTDLRVLQDDMEDFIMERRRELYTLEQDLHRELVEGAIAGSGIADLLRIAAERVGRTLALDRDGEVVHAGKQDRGPSRELLMESRLAFGTNHNGSIQLAGPPASLAIPVFTGRERRGIALLMGADEDALDEQEAVLSSLASACAIALGREPVWEVPALSEVLEGKVQELAQSSGPSDLWAAIALSDPLVAQSRLQRGTSSELSARRMSFVLAREGGELMVLVQGQRGVNWGRIVRAIQERAGTSGLRAGLSRESRGPQGAKQASKEAIEALHLGVGPVTRYEEVELEVLLKDVPGGDQFVRSMLGPLLDSQARSGDLLQTLKVYLETGRNAAESSRQLKVHRNTLLYRLRRIQEILGTDFDRYSDVFRVDLALRILAARDLEKNG
jgi:PucR C-terminal helix-turn-helix domain/GGDEF-like domain